MLFYSSLRFSLGHIFLAKSKKGLSLAQFVRDKNQLEILIKSLKNKHPVLSLNESKFLQEKELFERYFKGENEDFTSLLIDFISGTSYQKKVWLETRKITFGETRSYKFLAQQLNHKGYRSVGQALAQNPLIIVIPCHRVIKSDGTLGGFSAGLKIKKYLLQLEGIEKSF
ncbi:MAG: methylated-DNA--[protein]-cysteine S-methyltransferase [Candidatus Aminicenantaceae bacterium]